MGGSGGTSGETTPEQDSSESGWNDNDSSNLWDKLGGIGSALGTLVEKISNLPQLIADSIKGFFTDLKDGVLNGIKSIFIPDTDAIQASFNSFLFELKSKFGFDTSFFEDVLGEDGKPVTDIEGDYNIHGVGNMKLKFFDTEYLVQGVEYFRPFIRGFLVLLMAFYNIKMVLSFFRQDAGLVTGKTVSMGGKKE